VSTDALRPVIADILADQGYVLGAATLRQLHDEEGGLDDEELAELEYLRGVVEGIEDRLNHLDADTGKRATAAEFRRDVEMLLSGVGL
jgi:hypothetical protein